MTQHRGGSGNFAEDKERASEAGKKGGQHSGGNFKNDRNKASEAKGTLPPLCVNIQQGASLPVCSD